MEIEGKIEGIEISEGVANTGQPWKRWEFQINGRKYSTFDEGIGNNFKPNDHVKVALIQKGKYLNMQTMEKVEPKPQFKQKPPFEKTYEEIGKETQLDKQISIYVSYVKDLVVAGIEVDKAVNIINLARKTLKKSFENGDSKNKTA